MNAQKMNVPLVVTAEKTLQFPDPQLQAKFELGVSCAVFLWEELQTAVEQGWGGPESAEKREWAAASIVELFEGKEVEVEDIEYRLLGIMEDEFGVALETDTAGDVAETVMGCYAAVAQGQFQYIDAIYEVFQKKNKDPKNIQIEGESSDEGSDDEEEEDEAMQEPSEPKGPIIDDDGFELVQRRR